MGRKRGSRKARRKFDFDKVNEAIKLTETIKQGGITMTWNSETGELMIEAIGREAVARVQEAQRHLGVHFQTVIAMKNGQVVPHEQN